MNVLGTDDPELVKTLKDLKHTRHEFWQTYFKKWATHDAQDDQEFDTESLCQWNVEDETVLDEVETPEKRNLYRSPKAGNFEFSSDPDDADDEETPKKTSPVRGKRLKKVKDDSIEETTKKIKTIEVDDMLCEKCGKRTYLPFEYMENIGISLCNECTIKKSGHGNCEKLNCAVCMEIAKELLNRREVSSLFKAKKLVIVKDSEREGRHNISLPILKESKSLNRSLPLMKKREETKPKLNSTIMTVPCKKELNSSLIVKKRFTLSKKK